MAHRTQWSETLTVPSPRSLRNLCRSEGSVPRRPSTAYWASWTLQARPRTFRCATPHTSRTTVGDDDGRLSEMCYDDRAGVSQPGGESRFTTPKRFLRRVLRATWCRLVCAERLAQDVVHLTWRFHIFLNTLRSLSQAQKA
jgi:hypothetical protein